MDKKNTQAENNITQNTNKKLKILVISTKIEFEALTQFLLNVEKVKSFLIREMYNTLIFSPFSNYLKKYDGENELFTSIIIVPNKSKKSQCPYKVETIFINNFVNYTEVFLRLTRLNEKKKNKFIDINISIYKNIEDNSSVIIYEFKSDLLDEIFYQFCEISQLFHQRLENYFRKEMDNFFYYETITIEKNMANVFNYLSLCKICVNNKVKLKKVYKLKEKIKLTFDIFSQHSTKKEEFEITISNITKNCCLVTANNIVQSKNILDQECYLKKKPFLKYFLKVLKQKITDEKEEI